MPRDQPATISPKPADADNPVAKDRLNGIRQRELKLPQWQARQALKKLGSLGITGVRNLEGRILAWKAAGRPVAKSRKKVFPLMQQVQLGIGIGVLTGAIPAVTVNPNWVFPCDIGGGGFLFMPALVHFAKLPLRSATGTSLSVIAFNSAAGFISHFGEAPPRWNLAFSFAAIAATGVLLGSSLARHLPVPRLRPGFVFMVIITGSFVLWQSWIK